MRGKRHWYNNINWDLPIKNTKYWYKNLGCGSKRRLKVIAHAIGVITCILMVLLFIAIQVKEIIATDIEHQRIQRLEQIKLEKLAIEKEKQLKILAQETEQRSIETWNKFERQQNAIDSANAFYEKEAKKNLKIGSYIKTNIDGEEWIGKIKSIHGREITTTDNWKCYYGEDIQFSELKEYKKFIKDNSKG